MKRAHWLAGFILVALFSPGANAHVDESLWLPLVGASVPHDPDFARNDRVMCIPPNLYNLVNNPDAGGDRGLVVPFVNNDAGLITFAPNEVTVLAVSPDGGINATTPIYVCFMEGLTRANFRETCVSGPLCPTCPAGVRFSTKVNTLNRRVVCIVDTTVDAGRWAPAGFAR